MTQFPRHYLAKQPSKQAKPNLKPSRFGFGFGFGFGFAPKSPKPRTLPRFITQAPHVSPPALARPTRDRSTEPASDIILGVFVGGPGENHFGGVMFDQVAHVKKGGVIRDSARLLEVVGDDDNRVIGF